MGTYFIRVTGTGTVFRAVMVNLLDLPVTNIHCGMHAVVPTAGSGAGGTSETLAMLGLNDGEYRARRTLEVNAEG